MDFYPLKFHLFNTSYLESIVLYQMQGSWHSMKVFSASVLSLSSVFLYNTFVHVTNAVNMAKWPNKCMFTEETCLIHYSIICLRLLYLKSQ